MDRLEMEYNRKHADDDKLFREEYHVSMPSYRAVWYTLAIIGKILNFANLIPACALNFSGNVWFVMFQNNFDTFLVAIGMLYHNIGLAAFYEV